MRNPRLTWRAGHAKALWALFWRMILLGPVVMVFGTLTLVLVISMSIAPPLGALLLVINGDYLWTAAMIGGWLVWLRYGAPVRRCVLEGFEHGGL